MPRVKAPGVGVLPAYEAHAPVEARVNAFLAASGLTGPRTITSLPIVTVATPAGTFSARRVVVTYTYQPVVLAPVSAFFGGTFGAVPLRGVSVMRTEAAAGP
jgi:hypothetical protein